MPKPLKLVGVVGPLGLFRFPPMMKDPHLHYLTEKFTMKRTPWTELPNVNTVYEYLEIQPWEEHDEPVITSLFSDFQK